MKKEKKKIIITGISLFLFIILIGISYAYFATQTANGANELINIKTGTTDSLTFYVEKDLDIKANQGNFGSTDKTLSDSTYIEANLIANNYTNYAKESYNIYLQIEKNEFHYSTSDEIPELILKITDPENKEYTKMIGNIEYVSNVTDVENIKHSGYDITEESGLITIVENFEIIAQADAPTASTNHKWNFELKLINLDADQNDNAGKNFNCKIIITKNNKDNVSSVYSWNLVPLFDENISDTISTLKKLNIDSIYQHVPDGTLEDGTILKIAQKLKAENIKFYLLSGDSSYYKNPEKLREKIDLAANFNKVNNDKLINGVIFDIEASSNETFNQDVINNFNVYANTLENGYNYAHENNLEFINVVTFWYDTNYLEYANTEELLNSFNQSLNTILTMNDKVSVMNYHKDSMVNNISGEMEMVMKANGYIESIAEFQRPNGEAIPQSISFWIEDDPIVAAQAKWLELKKAYNNYAKLSFSYHNLETLMELTNDYKLNYFEVLDENASPVEGNLYILFGEDNYQLASNKNVALPAKNLDYYMEDKIILTKKAVEEADNKQKVTLNVKNKENYTFEMYFYVEDADGEVNLKNGTVYLIDKITKQEKSKSMSAGGYVALSNMFSDTDYEVKFMDEKGNEYYLDHATSNGNAGKDLLISNGKYLNVAADFESAKYIGVKIYLKSKNENKTYNLNAKVYGDGKLLDSGTLTLDSAMGKITCEVSALGTCLLNNVLENTNYIVTLNSNILKDIKATNDRGEEVVISSQNNLKIPGDFSQNSDINVSFNFDMKELYSIDVYIRDKALDEYIRMADTQVTIKNIDTSEEKSRNVQVASDGNYIYSFSKEIISDTLYKIELNLGNLSYTIDSIVIKNDEGTYVSVNVPDHDSSYFKIPKGSKENLRVNMRILLNVN